MVPIAPVMDLHVLRESLQALVTVMELVKQRVVWANLLQLVASRPVAASRLKFNEFFP